MSPGYLLAAAIYGYAGWAFAELVDNPRARAAVRVVIYVLTFVAWPLLMPWAPRYGLRRLRNKMGAKNDNE